MLEKSWTLLVGTEKCCQVLASCPAAPQKNIKKMVASIMQSFPGKDGNQVLQICSVCKEKQTGHQNFRMFRIG
jgi:hypothetical protein